MARPKKPENEKVQYQLIAVDKADYYKLKAKCTENRRPIKAVIKDMINLYA